ncbi:MAG: hypothetical protein AAGK38_12685 [Pseudomonadota bacterium]
MATTRKAGSYTGLEELGRVRLSRHFYMRNFLYSEIANFHGLQNMPDDPALAIEAGRGLCGTLLDPLVETFGPIEIRSAFRSVDLNHFGATVARPQKCAANDKNYAGHIWDRRDAKGHKGATVSITIAWFADQYNGGRDWRDLAWWVHDHLPHAGLQFFPINAAFNITWHEARGKSIYSFIKPKGKLLGLGDEPVEDKATRAKRYGDFPPFRGIQYPTTQHSWQCPS